MDFLNRGRWFFDPERGLKRSCKDPQKPDTALKNFWTKERRLQAFQSDLSESESDNYTTETEKPGPKTQSSAAGRKERMTAKGKATPQKLKKPNTVKRKRGRKSAVVVVASDEDRSEPEEELFEEMLPPPPKRQSRTQNIPTPPSSALLEERLEQEAPPSPVIPNRNPQVPPGVSDFSSLQLVLQQVPSRGTAGSSSSGLNVNPAPANNTSAFNPAMIQLLLSTAYDTATLNARHQEMQRREWENEQKRLKQQAEDSKAQFMTLAANAMNHFYHPPG